MGSERRNQREERVEMEKRIQEWMGEGGEKEGRIEE